MIITSFPWPKLKCKFMPAISQVCLYQSESNTFNLHASRAEKGPDCLFLLWRVFQECVCANYNHDHAFICYFSSRKLLTKDMFGSVAPQYPPPPRLLPDITFMELFCSVTTTDRQKQAKGCQLRHKTLQDGLEAEYASVQISFLSQLCKCWLFFSLFSLSFIAY